MAVETEIVRVKPPKSLLNPVKKPGPPALPPGEIRVEDMVDWYEQWLNMMEKAFESAEADKAGIRKWINESN